MEIILYFVFPLEKKHSIVFYKHWKRKTTEVLFGFYFKTDHIGSLVGKQNTNILIILTDSTIQQLTDFMGKNWFKMKKNLKIT